MKLKQITTMKFPYNQQQDRKRKMLPRELVPAPNESHMIAPPRKRRKQNGTTINTSTNSCFDGDVSNDEEEDFDVTDTMNNYLHQTINPTAQTKAREMIATFGTNSAKIYEEEEDIDVMGMTTETNTLDIHKDESRSCNIKVTTHGCNNNREYKQITGCKRGRHVNTLSPQTKRRKLNSPAKKEDIDSSLDINVSQLQCKNKGGKDENAGGQEEKEGEEEEEEEDFDVVGLNAKTRINKNELDAFGIGNVLSNIVSHLSIVEIIKLRRVNKLFNSELAFGFECKHFNVYFNYKNKYIIDIINHQYCDSLEHFTLFYLQSFNLKKSAFAFKRVSDKNTHTTKKEDCRKEKSGLTHKYIFCVSINNNEFPDDVQASPDFDFNVDFSIICDYGNVKMNPFKSLHSEIKTIKNNISKCDLYGNSTIDMLQLCRHYKFKPLQNTLKELMINNGEFRNFVHCKERGSLADGWMSFIWDEMGLAEKLFSWFWDATKSLGGGKPAFFADSALFGHFDVYEEFIKSLNGDVMKLRVFNLATHTIFAMFGVFLRGDLALNYVHHEKVFFYSAQTLAYVIQPQLLFKYKKSLIKNCMFVLNAKDEWEFDLLKNPRYHPNERIKFLQMLTNSTSFAQGLLHHVYIPRLHIRVELMNTIVRLMNSFDDFTNDWMLDKYSDLKGNNKQQMQIYETFKYCIQFLFGIGEYFVDMSKSTPCVTRFTPRHKTIIEANINGICDSSGLGIGAPMDNGFKFIDLNDDMIKNDRDLEFFIETLKCSRKHCNVELILHNLQYPQHGNNLNRTVTSKHPDLTMSELRFDEVSNIYEFLQRKWNYK